MLQQTTTAAVDAYYRRFLTRFPDVRTLAAAERTEVQRFWEGLGYYRRAKQLHEAAQVILQQHNGVFPTRFQDVLALPGIGRYTAGAVLSIAFDQRLPILEANTIRLHARLIGFSDNPMAGSGNRLLWKMAESVLPKTEPGHFNQALMDFGSLVCVPKNPDCCVCPMSPLCEAAIQGTQSSIPNLSKVKNIEERTELALVVENKGTFLFIRYPEGQRWGGLWDFPRLMVDSDSEIPHGPRMLREFRRLTGCTFRIQEPLMTLRHSVTRYKITLRVFRAEIIDRQNDSEYEVSWRNHEEIRLTPLNTTARKIADSLP
ncbi:MAG: A/G-specific adenine glycosylase [Planctomycetaceae bacterium]|jgi:A/G-specific adenine glycosylase|nr:A/G-specific adenine glycosylase [Planctomycetaceae bacterium]